MGKTVYILGAGFSKAAGAPLQGEIIPEIFKLNPDELHWENGDTEKYRKLFCEYRNHFRQLLENQFYHSPSGFDYIALEDIFTPIDRCIMDDVSFRNIPRSKLIKLRQKINGLIIILMKHRLQRFHGEYIRQFADYFVKRREESGLRGDPHSVITLNWDIMLDNALNKSLQEKEGIVDYRLTLKPFKESDKLEPALHAKGNGKFNVKLLKLHGSMNWLQCPRCQRLFGTFYKKIAAEEFLSKPKCRICQTNYADDNSNEGSYMISKLILPTFLKDLNNVQIKLLWHQAGIELSEADKLVFIGYSFPEADFEMRQLLARTVRHSAKIEVVERADKNGKEPESVINRYKNFFGKRTFNSTYEGVAQYINRLTATQASIN